MAITDGASINGKPVHDSDPFLLYLRNGELSITEMTASASKRDESCNVEVTESTNEWRTPLTT